MKKINLLNLLNLFIILIFLNIISIYSQYKNQKTENITNNKSYSFEIILNKDKTFGYKILVDGKVMINQESMPAVPGNKGFPRKIDAERMADLVILKITNGVMPPTITVHEVDSIKAFKN